MARHLPTVARYLLGLVFFVFGLNGFLNFIPAPPPEPKLLPFMTGLMSTGYFFPLLKGTETVCGALLLSNRLVPLALVVLSPIIVQIAAFHFVMAPSGAAMALVLLALLGFLAWSYRSYFRGVLTVRALPVAPKATPVVAEPATAS
jgi:uncharacterized membrane protein YphA (DoxX/SURF4 family)